MTPDPKQFHSITAYRLAQAQQAEAREFGRKLRRFLLAAALTVAVILATIQWGGIALYVSVIGGIIAGLGKVWFDLRWDTQRYREEHDLK